MRTLLILALAGCMAAMSASAQSPRVRAQTVPLPAGQDAAALQRAADERWSAVFAADRAFMQAVRDATGAEIALRRARGENVALLQAELARLQEMNLSFNMQYLMLQQEMQDENRRFRVISNIMRTKHGAARNSIPNVR